MPEGLEPSSPQEVLDFWFHELSPADWFASTPRLDSDIRRRFGDTHLLLARGAGDSWRENSQSHLAAIIVLDQFPRNIYRGTPLAFATDGLARNEARRAVASGHDRDVPAERRGFFYMPFEHSEDLADQDRSVALFTALGDAENLDYAERHRAVIRSFGRFPHRNAILARPSTPAELEYLSQPGAGF